MCAGCLHISIKVSIAIWFVLVNVFFNLVGFLLIVSQIDEQLTSS